MVHRQFSLLSHPFQKYTKAFNGEKEFSVASEPLSGEAIYDKILELNIQYGKQNRGEEQIKKRRKKGKKERGQKERG